MGADGPTISKFYFQTMALRATQEEQEKESLGGGYYTVQVRDDRATQQSQPKKKNPESSFAYQLGRFIRKMFGR
jgi:hypothetical protein